MSELVEFLRARISEDAAEIAKHPEGEDDWEFMATGEANYPCTPYLMIGKRRALAEVATKRRIMARHRVGDPAYGWPPRSCEGCGEVGEICEPRVKDIDECPELRDLASAYAGHGDYRAEWAA